MRRLRLSRVLLLGASITLPTIVSGAAEAATTFETATLGATGDKGPGVGVNFMGWYGFQFTTDEASRVVELGAHIRASQDGTVFGAILPIDGETGLPACTDLSCALHVEVFDPPSPSAEVVLPIDLALEAGDYALVFGSETGTSTGTALLPRNNTEVGVPLYFGRLVFGENATWQSNQGEAQNIRMFATIAVCGDGDVDPGEECDPAALGEACADDCTLLGDGTSTGAGTGETGSTGEDSDGTTGTGGNTSGGTDGGGTSTEGSSTSPASTTGSGPTTTSTTDAGGTTGSAEGSGEPASGSESGEGSAGETDDSSDGCSCRTDGAGGSGWLPAFVVALALGVTRRRNSVQ